MLYIKKRNTPPLLREFQKTPDATYDGFSSDAKREVYASLCKEQRYLCAYCMRRIEPEQNKLNKCQIEHYISRHSEEGSKPGKDIDYQNLLAVCDGTLAGVPKGTIRTCDKSKGDTPLTVDPRSKRSMDMISYKKDGEICSDQPGVEDDLKNVLNLNDPLLKDNRKAALDAFIEHELKRSKKSGTWSKRYFEKRHNDLLREAKGIEYSGILLWYLERKMSKL